MTAKTIADESLVVRRVARSDLVSLFRILQDPTAERRWDK